jgi:hypothetical protein
VRIWQQGCRAKSVTSLDALFCTVTIALGDVMEEFFNNDSNASGFSLPVFFRGAGQVSCR